jgi:pheromone shutdown protein TraB
MARHTGGIGRLRPLAARGSLFCALILLATAIQAADRPEIVLLGTIHGAHQKNPRYSVDILRDLIVKVRPAAILIELPPTIGGEATIEKERIVKRFAGNECDSANAAADILRIPVAACDREGRNEFYRDTRYFERERELNRRIASWMASEESAKLAPAEAALLGPLLENAARSRDDFMQHSGPETINSEGFDRVIRLKHYIWEELMPQLSARVPALADLAPEFAYFRDEWHERNRIMADNIATQAGKRAGQRVVVLTGCEHRYILRELLAKKPGMAVKEFCDP